MLETTSTFLAVTVQLFSVAVFTSTTLASSSSIECEKIANDYADWARKGGTGNFAGISGQTAYDCLRSMPFRPELATKFIDEYMGYLNFHSTIEMIKNPPAGYISTSIDLIRGFEKIRAKAAHNAYASQYEFDWDIDYLVSRANDGHLMIDLCSQHIMHFEHGMPLVSISEDGLQLPKLYALKDAELKLNGATTITPVTHINGIDAVYYLEANIAVLIGLQDPDARYNRLFFSPTANFSNGPEWGAWTVHTGLEPGIASRTLRFSNGTNLTVEFSAYWPSKNGAMNFRDGESLFRAACVPNSETTLGTHLGQRSIAVRNGLRPNFFKGYPEPLLRDQDNLIRGYYLNHSAVRDVAVLQVTSFRLANEIQSFARTAVEFLKKSSMDGKNKMIIDLSGNGGGDINQGFNLFRLFYPNENVYTATRFRATELVKLMGQIFSQDVNSAQDDVPQPLVFQQAVTSDQKNNFTSWEQLYGPNHNLDTNMSNLYATYNFTLASDEKNPISGFGGIPLDPPTQLFKTENIIIMTDGFCSSTCVIFVELMKKEGVRSIVFGGRPNIGPMQTLGGVKGGQSWSLSQISIYVSSAYKNALKASKMGFPIISADELKRFKEIAPPSLQDMSLRFNTKGGSYINFRNAYREGEDITPLQFIYEAAECRLFYTAENVFRPATTWLAASRSMWGQESCALSSINAPGSLVDSRQGS